MTFSRGEKSLLACVKVDITIKSSDLLKTNMLVSSFYGSQLLSGKSQVCDQLTEETLIALLLLWRPLLAHLCSASNHRLLSGFLSGSTLE